MYMRRRFFFKYFVFIVLMFFVIYSFEMYMEPNKPFYAEEKDSKDVLFCGTSFCYCTYDPAVFSENGIESYNLGKAMQPIIWTYYMMKDALEHQKPDVVILEPYAVTYLEKKVDTQDQGIANANFDAMEYSLNSLLGAYNNVPITRMVEFLFPIIRWHSVPWNYIYLGADTTKDPERGYIRFQGAGGAPVPSEEMLANENIIELDDISYEYLDAMYKLTKEHNAELIIIRSPFPLWETERFNAVKQWASQKGITYLDLTHYHNELGIDYNADTLDGNHLNESGARKVSTFISNWLKENGKITKQ